MSNELPSPTTAAVTPREGPGFSPEVDRKDVVDYLHAESANPDSMNIDEKHSHFRQEADRAEAREHEMPLGEAFKLCKKVRPSLPPKGEKLQSLMHTSGYSLGSWYLHDHCDGGL